MPTFLLVSFGSNCGTAIASSSTGFALRSTRADERGAEAIAIRLSKQLSQQLSFGHSPYTGTAVQK